jgi:hypothetical protein
MKGEYAMTDSGLQTYMPVAPTCNNGGFGGYNDDIWLIIILLFACGGWGNGFGGGFGGGFGNMMLGYDFPWLLNGQQGINNNVSSGFRDAQISDGITSVRDGIAGLSTQMCSGFGNVSTQLCNGFNGVTASVNGAQNALAQQMYTNQIADMERSFAAQTANTQGMNNIQSQLANCCCENRAATADLKYTVATEECNTRNASATNTRDIIESQTRGTQAILDKLCQLELDGVKAQVDAKNDRIVDLQNQLNMASFRESQVAQNALIQNGLNQEVDALYNRLSNCPVPSTPVYGRTPIFTCNQQPTYGCACGM